MKNFRRALRLIFHYPRLLTLSIVCSLLVAALWGGNIGALYPIVEVTLKGQSLQQWTDERIELSETKAAQLENEISDLEAQLAAPDSADKQALNRQLSLAEHRRTAENKTTERARRIQPLVNRFLPDKPFQTVLLIVAALLVATAVKDFFLVGNLLSTDRLMQRVTLDLRQRFYDHVLAMDMKAMQQKGTASLMQHFEHDIMAIGNGVRCLIGGAVREPLKMIVCAIGAAAINWRLFLFMFILAPVAGISVRMIACKIRHFSNSEMSKAMQMNRLAFDSFNGLQTVQSYTMETFESSRFREACKGRMRRSLKIAFYKSMTKPATELLGITAVGLILIVGAFLVLNQETHMFGIRFCDRPMSIGTLLVFYALLVGMSEPAQKLTEIYTGIQLAIAASDRLFAIFDKPPEIVDPETPKALLSQHLRLEMNGVTFHYNSEKPVLQDITLTIPRGQTLAIVGENGCGKSTLARLIPRFIDPDEGSVTMDGIDLRDVSLADLRQRIGVVTQQMFLFDDTVLNNIRYGSPDATDEQAFAAAKMARAHSFIVNELPKGYETAVGQDGNCLSGGQRQRIALARAVLRDPEILILDEFTSQVDVKSEMLLHEALKTFVQERTTIIVTHRASTLDLADKILVMEAGRIVDAGRHEELIGRCELYRRLRQTSKRRAA